MKFLFKRTRLVLGVIAAIGASAGVGASIAPVYEIYADSDETLELPVSLIVEPELKSDVRAEIIIKGVDDTPLPTNLKSGIFPVEINQEETQVSIPFTYNHAGEYYYNLEVNGTPEYESDGSVFDVHIHVDPDMRIQANALNKQGMKCDISFRLMESKENIKASEDIENIEETKINIDETKESDSYRETDGFQDEPKESTGADIQTKEIVSEEISESIADLSYRKRQDGQKVQAGVPVSENNNKSGKESYAGGAPDTGDNSGRIYMILAVTSGCAIAAAITALVKRKRT